MDRREFIQQAAIGIPVLFRLPRWFSNKGDKEGGSADNSRQVIIIGAGISGLSAASYLKRKGLNPIVFEAQNRVGGRLKTDRSQGVEFDEGASWIHGPGRRNPIRKLAKKSGMKTFLTEDDNLVVYDQSGKRIKEEALEEAESAYNKILNHLEGRKGESFEEAFLKQYPQYKENPLWTYQLSAFLEFDTGADISDLTSLDYYDDKSFWRKDVIATNGYDKITDYLASGLDIRLNEKVNGIDYSQNDVRIETNTGVYSADSIVVTVPLGVLQHKKVNFFPSLPEKKLQAIDRTGMGVVNKFLCIWEESFWDNKQYIGYTAQEKGKFNYFLNVKLVNGTNALMTFAFGDYAVKTEKLTDQEVMNEIMKHLKVMYGNDIPAPSKLLRTKWGEDENTFGSYSFVGKEGRSSDYTILAEPIADKLFFAGEHTSKNYRGTVHGAYLSGKREGKKVLRALRRK